MPSICTRAGALVHVRRDLDPLATDQMLAALIDAEEMLVDYASAFDDERPCGLYPAIYKVRDAIRAAEDPDRKVSVRCG